MDIKNTTKAVAPTYFPLKLAETGGLGVLLEAVGRVGGEESLHIIVDIETLDVVADAYVYSVGLAVLADSGTNLRYVGSATWPVALGKGDTEALTAHLSTVVFHVKTHNGADPDLVDSITGADGSLTREQTGEYLRKLQTISTTARGEEDVRWYSRGKDFDLPKLNAMAGSGGLGIPFWRLHCLRDLFSGFGGTPRVPKYTGGWKVTHRAGEDALLEANELAWALVHLRQVTVDRENDPVLEREAYARRNAVTRASNIRTLPYGAVLAYKDLKGKRLAGFTSGTHMAIMVPEGMLPDTPPKLGEHVTLPLGKEPPRDSITSTSGGQVEEILDLPIVAPTGPEELLNVVAVTQHGVPIVSRRHQEGEKPD